jgi:hypothetical protein
MTRDMSDDDPATDPDHQKVRLRCQAELKPITNKEWLRPCGIMGGRSPTRLSADPQLAKPVLQLKKIDLIWPLSKALLPLYWVVGGVCLARVVVRNDINSSAPRLS